MEKFVLSGILLIDVYVGDEIVLVGKEEFNSYELPEGRSLYLDHKRVFGKFVLNKDSMMTLVYSGNDEWYCTGRIGDIFIKEFEIIPHIE